MKYFDFHGEKISRLGFGLMRLPVINDDQSAVDYDKVEEMFLYAYENGINYFDSAFPYHNGFSEKTLGKILTNNHLHDKVNVATKLFTLGIKSPDFDPRKMLDEQLSRLQQDHIDFYLMHGLHGDQWEYLCEHFDIKNYLKDLKTQGVLRHLGFSFHDTYEKFVEIIDDFDEWEFAQIQYNYLDHEYQAGDKGLAYARSKGIPLNVMEPCKGGSLIFPNYPEVEEIKKRHGLENVSNAELAFSYVFDKPGFMVVLSGMNEMSQMKENIEIANKYDNNTLSPEANAAIDEIRYLLEHSENIPCTGCRYCTAGCPMQIQIPNAFSIYNEAQKFKNPAAQKRNYDRACANIADCIECGQCQNACPQHLEIPQLLKKVREYMEG